LSGKKPKADKTWPVSWAANEKSQLEASLAATPAQRLEWLEQAIELAYRTGALKPDTPESSATDGAGMDARLDRLIDKYDQKAAGPELTDEDIQAEVDAVRKSRLESDC